MSTYNRFVVRNVHTGEVIASPGVAPRETLYECLERNHIPIRTTCRGSTICGLCWVQVVDGYDELAPAIADERELLDTHAPGVPNARLACRLRLPPGRKELTVELDPPE